MVAITLLHYTSILSMDMLSHATMGLFEAMVSEVRLLPKKVWTLTGPDVWRQQWEVLWQRALRSK